MKQKKIWSDPSFWILAGVNGFIIYYYYRNPALFTTLIWVYWAQSVAMGAFNVLDILTVRKVNTHQQFMQEGKPVTTSFTRRIPSALFFIFHFGLFHLGYYVFLRTMPKTGPIDRELFRYLLYAFIGGQVVGFIQHKVQQWNEETSLSSLFATPYIRIIPMHLTIICSNFFPGAGLGLFLVLKSACDVVTYIATKPKHGSKGRQADAALLAAQQSMKI